MKKIIPLFRNILLLIILIILSCKHIPRVREVTKNPDGGIISLKMNYCSKDKAKAEEFMKQNCGNREVKIIKEGEVVVGSKPTTNDPKTPFEPSPTNNKPFTIGSTQAENLELTSIPKDITEWQIEYKCIEVTPQKEPSKEINKKQ